MLIDEYIVIGRPSGQVQKPTAQQKRIVIAACEPLIASLKENISPIPDKLEINHLVDIYGKWFRNQYHIYLVYHCPPNSFEKKMEFGLARLGWTGGDTYILSSYMAHRKKWEAFYEKIPLEKAIERIADGDYFSF